MTATMTRTNIELDDVLVQKVMQMYRLDSKRAAVQLALERLVGPIATIEEVLAYQGHGYPLSNDELEGIDEPVDLGDPTGWQR